MFSQITISRGRTIRLYRRKLLRFKFELKVTTNSFSSWQGTSRRKNIYMIRKSNNKILKITKCYVYKISKKCVKTS